MNDKIDFRSMLKTAEVSGRAAMAPNTDSAKATAAPEQAPAPEAPAPEAAKPAAAPKAGPTPKARAPKQSAEPSEPVEYVQYRARVPFDLYHDAQRYAHARKMHFAAFCEAAMREYMKNHP